MIEKIIANLSANFESRVSLFRALALIVALTAAAVSSSKMIRAPFAHGDFGVYLNAARLLAAGQNIYTTPTHPVETGGLFYIYPPLLALLLVPLTYIPDNVSIVFWCLLNVFLVAWAIPAACEIVSQSPFSALPVKTRWAIGLFALLLTARFILQHLDRGEANILEMALLLLGIKLARSDRQSLLGGAVIGVSMALKVITAPFTLWYALQKNLKALAGAAMGVVAGLLSPALFLGWKANASLLSFWFANFVGNVGERESKLGLGYNFSIRAQLYRFFTPAVAFEGGGRSYSLTIFQAPAGWIDAADWLLRFIIVGVVVWYWFRCRKSSDLILNGGGMALLFAAIPLLFPTAQKNYFVFLLPTSVYLMYLWFGLKFKDSWFRGLILASFALSSLTTQGICGEFLSNVSAASGCVLWGTILLMIAVFRAATMSVPSGQTA